MATRPPEPDDIAALVIETVPELMDAIRQAMRRHVGDEMSVPQFRCLNFISKHPDCSIGEVAGLLGVTMPTASSMVDRLVKSGAVDSRSNVTDRRRANLRITDSGARQLRQIRRLAREDFAKALSACTADERASAGEGLQALRRALRTD